MAANHAKGVVMRGGIREAPLEEFRRIAWTAPDVGGAGDPHVGDLGEQASDRSVPLVFELAVLGRGPAHHDAPSLLGYQAVLGTCAMYLHGNCRQC